MVSPLILSDAERCGSRLKLHGGIGKMIEKEDRKALKLQLGAGALFVGTGGTFT